MASLSTSHFHKREEAIDTLINTNAKSQSKIPPESKTNLNKRLVSLKNRIF